MFVSILKTEALFLRPRFFSSSPVAPWEPVESVRPPPGPPSVHGKVILPELKKIPPVTPQRPSRSLAAGQESFRVLRSSQSARSSPWFRPLHVDDTTRRVSSSQGTRSRLVLDFYAWFWL